VPPICTPIAHVILYYLEGTIWKWCVPWFLSDLDFYLRLGLLPIQIAIFILEGCDVHNPNARRLLEVTRSPTVVLFLEFQHQVAQAFHNGQMLRAAPPPPKHWPRPIDVPEDLDEEDVPDDFVCSITRSIMCQPALVSVTGHTYDYEAIARWHTNSKGVDPKSGTPFSLNDLAPNHALRNLIDDWVQKQRVSSRVCGSSVGLDRIPQRHGRDSLHSKSSAHNSLYNSDNDSFGNTHKCRPKKRNTVGLSNTLMEMSEGRDGSEEDIMTSKMVVPEDAAASCAQSKSPRDRVRSERGITSKRVNKNREQETFKRVDNNFNDEKQNGAHNGEKILRGKNRKSAAKVIEEKQGKCHGQEPNVTPSRLRKFDPPHIPDIPRAPDVSKKERGNLNAQMSSAAPDSSMMLPTPTRRLPVDNRQELDGNSLCQHEDFENDGSRPMFNGYTLRSSGRKSSRRIFVESAKGSTPVEPPKKKQRKLQRKSST